LKKVPIIEYSDYQSLSKAVADLVLSRITDSSSLTIGLATGSSPKKAYGLIAKLLEKQTELVRKIEVAQLDEWIGLPVNHSASCHYYLKKYVIQPWNLQRDQYLLLNGIADCPESEIAKLNNHLAESPLDLCILGMGTNGHLALNEPGSGVVDSCRIVELHPSSRLHPMLDSQDIKVTKGMTIGLKELLESREIILIITGKNKREAFNQLLSKDPDSECPATALYLHNNWTCFVDNSALN